MQQGTPFHHLLACFTVPFLPEDNSSLAAEGSFVAAGSLGAAAAARQHGGGNCSLAVAGSLAVLAAAQQRCGGSGSLVAAGS